MSPNYPYASNRPTEMVDPDGRWPFWIHNLIYDFAFAGVYSSREIGVIQKASWNMDFAPGQQGAWPDQTAQHGMCSSGQSQGDCDNNIGWFVESQFQAASATSGDESLTFEGSGLHTVSDIGSQMHTHNGHGIIRTNGFIEGIEHEAGEISIMRNLYNIGQSIRNAIEFDALLHPEHAKQRGGVSTWENKAVSAFADSVQTHLPLSAGPDAQHSQDRINDQRRLCALGNVSACN